MAKTNKAPLFVRLGNILTLTLLRAGLPLVGPFMFFGNYPMYLFTVHGRKSGLPRTVAAPSAGPSFICMRIGPASPSLPNSIGNCSTTLCKQ